MGDEVTSCYLSIDFGASEATQFLEARIIPERIEHRIEPEQRRSKRTLVSAPRTVSRVVSVKRQ